MKEVEEKKRVGSSYGMEYIHGTSTAAFKDTW